MPRCTVTSLDHPSIGSRYRGSSRSSVRDTGIVRRDAIRERVSGVISCVASATLVRLGQRESFASPQPS